VKLGTLQGNNKWIVELCVCVSVCMCVCVYVLPALLTRQSVTLAAVVINEIRPIKPNHFRWRRLLTVPERVNAQLYSSMKAMKGLVWDLQATLLLIAYKIEFSPTRG